MDRADAQLDEAAQKGNPSTPAGSQAMLAQAKPSFLCNPLFDLSATEFGTGQLHHLGKPPGRQPASAPQPAKQLARMHPVAESSPRPAEQPACQPCNVSFTNAHRFFAGIGCSIEGPRPPAGSPEQAHSEAPAGTLEPQARQRPSQDAAATKGEAWRGQSGAALRGAPDLATIVENRIMHAERAELKKELQTISARLAVLEARSKNWARAGGTAAKGRSRSAPRHASLAPAPRRGATLDQPQPGAIPPEAQQWEDGSRGPRSRSRGRAASLNGSLPGMPPLAPPGYDHRSASVMRPARHPGSWGQPTVRSSCSTAASPAGSRHASPIGRGNAGARPLLAGLPELGRGLSGGAGAAARPARAFAAGPQARQAAGLAGGGFGSCQASRPPSRAASPERREALQEAAVNAAPRPHFLQRGSDPADIVLVKAARRLQAGGENVVPQGAGEAGAAAAHKPGSRMARVAQTAAKLGLTLAPVRKKPPLDVASPTGVPEASQALTHAAGRRDWQR